MTRYLCLFNLLFCLISCTIKTKRQGKVLVNQELVASYIQDVQPAKKIDFSIITSNGKDSTLVVTLTVDSKIPDDSLDIRKARTVLSSFLTTISDLQTYSYCKIIFVRPSGSNIKTNTAFTLPLTPEVQKAIAHYKDSTRVSLGYIDTGWTYINKDLNLSLKLKNGWHYSSDEHDSIVDYLIGSDINELPQYRTDPDQKLSFITIQQLAPGEPFRLLQINRNKVSQSDFENYPDNYKGPLILLGFVSNPFDSDTAYLKNLYQLRTSKKITDKQIYSYNFGNAVFLGYRPATMNIKNRAKIEAITCIKMFKQATMMLTCIYSNAKDLTEIKNQLSNLKID